MKGKEKMKYKVVLVPENRKFEDVWDEITIYCDTKEKALDFIEMLMSFENDCSVQLIKIRDGE